MVDRNSGVLDEEDSGEMAYDLAYGLAKSAYGLDTRPVRSMR